MSAMVYHKRFCYFCSSRIRRFFLYSTSLICSVLIFIFKVDIEVIV